MIGFNDDSVKKVLTFFFLKEYNQVLFLSFINTILFDLKIKWNSKLLKLSSLSIKDFLKKEKKKKTCKSYFEKSPVRLSNVKIFF